MGHEIAGRRSARPEGPDASTDREDNAGATDERAAVRLGRDGLPAAAAAPATQRAAHGCIGHGRDLGLYRALQARRPRRRSHGRRRAAPPGVRGRGEAARARARDRGREGGRRRRVGGGGSRRPRCVRSLENQALGPRRRERDGGQLAHALEGLRQAASLGHRPLAREDERRRIAARRGRVRPSRFCRTLYFSALQCTS